MKFTDGMMYEIFIKQFIIDGRDPDGQIVCIINGTAQKLFKNMKELPTDLNFVECLNDDEYYFTSIDNSGGDKYCFFDSIGKKLYDIWRGNHKNKFLEKKTITITSPSLRENNNLTLVFESRSEDNLLVVEERKF